MSNELPKEQMSAYQRWEMSSFDKPGTKPVMDGKPTVLPPSQETIDLIKEEARQQGFAKGLAEGRAQGLAEGQAVSKQDASRFAEILDNLMLAVAQIDTEIARDIMTLALDISKAVVHTTLQTQPELLLSIISDSIHELPSIQKPATIYLHPSDTKLVQDGMLKEIARDGWGLREDAGITPGGCRIETGTNIVDATLESRWLKIAKALAVDSSQMAKS